jgi:uncharacterized protein YuzE
VEFEYDQTADALYVRLTSGLVTKTVEYDRGTLVDLDEGGRPVGIEIIRPARRVPFGELCARFGIPQGTASLLEEMWSKRFPYTPDRLVATTS